MSNPLDDPKNKAKLEAFLIEHAPTINMHVKKLKAEGKIPQHIDDGDLHMAGFRGLMEAAHRYKPEVGANFSTYAGTRIRGKMLDHVAESGDIPKHLMNQAKNIKNSQGSEGSGSGQPQ